MFSEHLKHYLLRGTLRKDIHNDVIEDKRVLFNDSTMMRNESR